MKLKELPPLAINCHIVYHNDVKYVIKEAISTDYYDVTLMEMGTKVYHTEGEIYDFIMNDFKSKNNEQKKP